MAFLTVKRSEQSGGAVALGPSPANIPEDLGEKHWGVPDKGLPDQGVGVLGQASPLHSPYSRVSFSSEVAGDTLPKG